jgi:dolichol-phosphate mannosyltransferase
MVSIILPTYNEAENLEPIVTKIWKVLNDEDIKFEIIVVDDNSPDSTANIALELATKYPVRVHVRKNERGLATAVVKGFSLAQGDICVLMDADLSHPVERIPDMIQPILEDRCNITVGSRYGTEGGCADWPLIRRIISKGAGLLAKGLTKLSDPTSGFMALRKEILKGIKLNPVGWKIVLEVIVKTNSEFIEVPIVFSERAKGKSKLDIKAQIDYLRHLYTLYCYKYTGILQFIKFSLVGFSGLLIDTAVLVSLVELVSIDPRFAAIFAFITAVSWNYVLNRFWTFEHGKTTKFSSSYISFVTVCSLGLGVRIGVMHLLIEYAKMGSGYWYIVASVLGIGVATVFNFLGSKYIVFSKVFATRTSAPKK